MRNLLIQSALPAESVSHFVHSFWMLENRTGQDLGSTVLPNGMVDFTLTKKPREGWKILLRGIDTEASRVVIEKDVRIFTIGLKLLAVEYLLGGSLRDLPREGKPMPEDPWRFEADDVTNLEHFSARATEIILDASTPLIDSRKRDLFTLIYATEGAMPVQELSTRVFWSARQINRYFNQRFGLSLKAYCNLLRLGSSFRHLSEGRLFPEQSFSDQNHFIKEIRKFSGVTPGELSKNEGDRFIDITAIRHLPS